MKSVLLDTVLRIFVGPEGKEIQSVFVRIQMRVICIATLPRLEALALCSTLRETVKDREDELASMSPFAFDRNAKKDSEVEPRAEKSDTTSVVKPKAVFKGAQQTSDSAGAPLKVEIGDGLWVPVDTKMIVSPGGLAPSCECSWSGCQHPSHNADRLERQEVKDVESDKPCDSRNAPDVSVDPFDVIPGEEKSDDPLIPRQPLEMCGCSRPDCSHPSHGPKCHDD